MSTLGEDVAKLHSMLRELEQLCSCTRREMTPAKAGTYRAKAATTKRLVTSIQRRIARPPAIQSSDAKREWQQHIEAFEQMDCESKLDMLDSLFVHGQFSDIQSAIASANQAALMEEEEAREKGQQHWAMSNRQQEQMPGRLHGAGKQREDVWADELEALQSDAGALAQIYEEFAVLIEAQQDVIDGIDAHTAATVDDLILGFEQLGQHEKAATWKRYKLRWTTGGAAVGGVVGAIGGAGVGAVIGSSRNAAFSCLSRPAHRLFLLHDHLHPRLGLFHRLNDDGVFVRHDRRWGRRHPWTSCRWLTGWHCATRGRP